MGHTSSKELLPNRLTVTAEDCGVIGGAGNIITFMSEDGVDSCSYDIPTTPLLHRVFYLLPPEDFRRAFGPEYSLYKDYDPGCVYVSCSYEAGKAPAAGWERTAREADGRSVAMARNIARVKAMVLAGGNPDIEELFRGAEDDNEDGGAARPASHPEVGCDVCGMSPLIGNRYHKIGHNYDLCEADFNKLSTGEQQADYKLIAYPEAVHPPLFLLRTKKGMYKDLHISGPKDAQCGIRSAAWASVLGDNYGFTTKWSFWGIRCGRGTPTQLPGTYDKWQMFLSNSNYMQRNKSITFSSPPVIDCAELTLLNGDKTGAVRVEFGEDALAAVYAAALSANLRHGCQPEDICLVVHEDGFAKDKDTDVSQIDTITAASIVFRPSISVKVAFVGALAKHEDLTLTLATEWGLLDASPDTTNKVEVDIDGHEVKMSHPLAAPPKPTTLQYLRQKVSSVLGCEPNRLNFKVRLQDGQPARKLGRNSALLQSKAGVADGAVVVVSVKSMCWASNAVSKADIEDNWEAAFAALSPYAFRGAGAEAGAGSASASPLAAFSTKAASSSFV